MSPKKTATLGPLRLTEDQLSGYKRVLKDIGMDRAAFSTLVIDTLIRHHNLNERLALPLRFKVVKEECLEKCEK